MPAITFRLVDLADALKLADVMAAAARALQAEEGPQRTLQKFTELAVEGVEGCDYAGVSMVYGDRITTPAATDDVPVDVDRLQYETGQGPCLDAIRHHEVFRTGDLREEDRWPDFATRATQETGVRSMLAVRLFLAEDTLGSLNLYSKRPDAFTDDSIIVARLLATQAAVAVSAARESERADDVTDRLRTSRQEADRYQRQAEVALVLQRSMLTELPDVPPLQLTARYVPAVQAAEVGGDWYDAVPLPSGAVLLVVGDIAGHDVTAAAAMAQARSMLRALAVDRDDPPGRLLSRFDAVLRHLGIARIARIARLEARDGAWQVTVASAGHPPPLLIGVEGARYLDLPNEVLLGTGVDAVRTDHRVGLPPGSTLLLYTDGLIERRDRIIDDGMTALRDAADDLHRDGHVPDIDSLCDSLVARLAPHPRDDLCVLALRVPGPPPTTPAESRGAGPAPQPGGGRRSG